MGPRLVTLRRWLGDLSPFAQDALLAAALSVFTQYELWIGSEEVEGSIVLQRGAFAAMTLAVAARRIAPLTSVCIVAVALVVQTVFGGNAPVVGGFLAMIIVIHSVATYRDRRRAIVGLIVMLTAGETYPIVNREEVRLADEIGNMAIFVVVWGLARAVRSRQHRAEELEDRAVRLENEQEEQRRLAIAEERARIARELHDIVAHGVSLMVLQAGGARQLLGDGSPRIRESLLAVEQAGRQALGEMHRLLGVLRTDSSGLPSPAPAGLDRVDELAQQMKAAGLPVQVSVEGAPRQLAQSVDLSAYRIIQEALTNCLKHAGPTQAEVRIRYGDDDVGIEVRDDGQGRPKRGRGPGGNGLIGMRERAALFGGSLHAGPRPDGGWLVSAQLPAGDQQ